MTDDVEDRLTAGVARADVTPETGRSFQGYVRPDIRSEGVGSRLFARALVLDDGDGKVAVVSADLLYGIDKDEVVDRVRPLGFDDESVLYFGTHTHAATEAGDWTAAQVARAIRNADGRRKPAVAGWGSAEVTDVSRNRSPEAHLANYGRDLPSGEVSGKNDSRIPDTARDTTLRLLRVDSADGSPLAALTIFSVHPTAFPPSNTVYSADIAGEAARYLSQRLGDGPESTEPVSLFSYGAGGDLIPVYDGHNPFAVASRLGERLADGMVEAWEDSGDSLTHDLAINCAGRTVRYEGQEVEPGRRVGEHGVFGAPFLGGAENGPSPLRRLGLEGRRRPRILSDEVHGRKIPVAPVPWDNEAEVQVVGVGDTLILAAPGEPTVQTGRRWAEGANEMHDGTDDAVVVGVANGYKGYFTTPEEYEQQHYEGGHTVFGKYTEAVLRNAYTELASRLNETGTVRERKVSEGSSPSEADSEAPVGKMSSGSLTDGPDDAVERMSVVKVRWTGGPSGTDRPVGEPFLRLERSTDDGWMTEATDLGLGFVWTVDGDEYVARYEIPPDAETGTYRISVTAAGYELETEGFSITPSTDLRPLGVEIGDDGRLLVFRAQNPPPDPDIHLRHRRKSPRGGRLEFVIDGEEKTAVWSSELEGWTCEAPEASAGDTVTVPEGGLVDKHGNKSGDAKRLTVGEEMDRIWPPSMSPGGGTPPRPFGVGAWKP